MVKIILGIMIAVILTSTFVVSANDKLTRCNKDTDCFMSQSTYCGCNMGGNQIAVNKFGLAYWDLWRKINYPCTPIYDRFGNLIDCRYDYVCLAVYNCFYTQSVCENKVCVLR